MRSKTLLIAILVFSLLAASCGSRDSSHADVGFTPDEVCALGPLSLTRDGAVYLYGSMAASSASSYGAAVGEGEAERAAYEQWLLTTLMPEEFSALAALNVIAAEEGLSLSNRDDSAIRAVITEDIVLTLDDGSFYTVPKETVWQLLKAYRLADMAIARLSENISISVSDDEVRVISIRQLLLADSGEAMGVFTSLEEGEPFEAVVGMYAGSTLRQMTLRRGGEDKILEDAAFALKTGEYSMPVNCADGWCILYCDSEYDPSLTRENRSQLLREARENAWLSRVEETLAGQVLYRNADLADNLVLAEPAAEDSLFALYRRVFPDAG